MTEIDNPDRRVRKTQLAIFNAFLDLVLSRRYDEIRVADIIEAADVGRSTFYDHFTSKDDVLLRSIEGPFSVLVDMVSGTASRERVLFIVSHFWDQRAMGRIIFSSELYFKLVRKLAEMIEPQIPPVEGGLPARGQAIDIASRQLGLIRSWVTGEFACDAEVMTDHLMQEHMSQRSSPSSWTGKHDQNHDTNKSWA